MCLTLVQKPKQTSASKASDFNFGTWFFDRDDQVYVIVNDDQNDKPIIVCVGDFYKPFVVQVPLDQFEVFEILDIGCTLQITRSAEEGFNND